MEKEARWLVLARVHTRKPFGPSTFKDHMRYIWSLSQDAEIREVGDNRFLCKFFYLGDWKKVMQQGTWLFKGHMVVMEDYDGRTKFDEVPLNRVLIWAQIHGIPEPYRRPAVTNQLARRIAKVQNVELNPPKYYEGD
ncbi:hypothetical protein BRADI_3g36101v3 [Brachypodium distachyon]|uniref:DUF4283 domain-containing protein n=1 Tax=Brachypodium distachyon TaxID=15368 RepID=A0A0Q3JJ55_BRADI|nr:hypothetical protein BRADI_3g36101v3 [Brachypodium distachyon]